MLVGSPFGRWAVAFRGRRPFSFRPSWISGWLLAAALPWVAACSKAPEFDVSTARSNATRVLATLERDEPEQARHLKNLVEIAEGATLRERGEPFWRREDSNIANAWGRVAEASVGALAQLKENRDAARKRWTEADFKATKALTQAREQVKVPGLSRREQNLVQQAALTIETARRLAAGGELDRATAQITQALEKTMDVAEAWESLHARFDDRGALRRWKALVDEAVTLSARQDSNVFVVDKLERRLYVYSRGRRVDSFPVELGAKGLKRKLHAGDRATPEGRYRVTEVRAHGATKYYKALMLDYPNSEDRARWAEARRKGQVPRGAGPGSLIEIHGYGGKGKDWTDGCIALTNAAMDRLFRYATVNTQVVIVGTLPGDKEGR